MENMKRLENISKNKLESNDIKILFDKINNDKESLKSRIQKIFTKIRNALEEREDELLLEVDKQFKDMLLKEEIIKESEKLSKKIEILLEKGKIIVNNWNDNNLNSLINDCIYIENNIENIIKINENLKNFNLNKNIEINFEPDENNINQFLEKIKSFGKINIKKNSYNFRFNNCPKNISKNKEYIVKGEKGNIITKLGEDEWVGVSCEPKLKEPKEYKWKIKILNSQYNNIMFGVAPADFDINTSFYEEYGWYLFCFLDYTNPELFSGPPYNYKGLKTNLNKLKDEIIIILDIEKRTLKFLIDNEDKGDSYKNIPIEKPFVPVVFLYNSNDSVEIIEC